MCSLLLTEKFNLLLTQAWTCFELQNHNPTSFVMLPPSPSLLQGLGAGASAGFDPIRKERKHAPRP